jgi:SAM-dependent methyltransferase
MKSVALLRKAARRADSLVPWEALYAGDRVECPCCGGSFRAFRRRRRRPDALCPRCQALERHRLLWLYLRDRTTLFSEPLDVLHVAPEPVFESRLRALDNLSAYVAGDLYPKGRQVRIDLTAIDRPDDSFDMVLCNHVLEEVPDDRRAMREIARVLRPGGRFITQTPFDPSRERTLEGQVMSALARRRTYGAAVNVRLYGRDLADRLSEAGLEVSHERYLEQLPEAVVERHALAGRREWLNGHDIFDCKLADRAIASARSTSLS